MQTCAPQGRIGGDFDDRNAGLISALCAAHPNLISLEMETFHLLDLARCSRGEVTTLPCASQEQRKNAHHAYNNSQAK